MKMDFISGAELPLKELQKIIDQAMSFKKTKKLPDLSGKILTLLFANPSLRTRLSFETGMKKMNGIVNTLELAGAWQFEYRDGVKMDQDKQEHIREAAAVISRYSDVIALRKSELVTTALSHGGNVKWEDIKKDEPINQLAKYASKPVINMESNMYHPCQAMADMMTMQEKFGDVKGKKYVITWAPHIKALALATPHSQFLTPAIFGMNVVLAAPDGFPLDEDIMKLAEQKSKEAGGKITLTNNQKEAFKDADVIVAKSWASLKYFGDWEAEAKHRKQFEDWIVDEEKIKLTNNAMFMHCLPVRRNIEVSAAILDGLNSSVIDEAENRMWAQMAIVSNILNNKK